MLVRTLQWILVIALGYTLAPLFCPNAYAEGAETVDPQTFVLRLGAGVAIPTQTVLRNTDSSTEINSTVNFEGLYVVKEWLRVGVMYQYVPLNIDLASGARFGSLQTHSLLPTVEFRPTKAMLQDHSFRWMTPYASLGVGVNWHTFKSASAARNDAVSFPMTVAVRLSTGFDVPITEYVSFNAEIAWNYDAGHYKVNAAEADFNASAVNALAGLRLHY